MLLVLKPYHLWTELARPPRAVRMHLAIAIVAVVPVVPSTKGESGGRPLPASKQILSRLCGNKDRMRRVVNAFDALYVGVLIGGPHNR